MWISIFSAFWGGGIDLTPWDRGRAPTHCPCVTLFDPVQKCYPVQLPASKERLYTLGSVSTLRQWGQKTLLINSHSKVFSYQEEVSNCSLTCGKICKLLRGPLSGTLMGVICKGGVLKFSCAVHTDSKQAPPWYLMKFHESSAIQYPSSSINHLQYFRPVKSEQHSGKEKHLQELEGRAGGGREGMER